jgi:hypothetical protein
MAKNIIIHLGLHKTATTSLQEFLQANVAKFLQRGVRYIPLQRMRTDITPLFWAVDKGRRAKLTSLLETFDQETILLSDENLIGVPGELAQGGLYPYAANRVRTFCEDMKETRITLFLTLREPHLFLTSMYSEYLRHNDFVTFEQFLAGFDISGFSYQKTFGWLKNMPSNTRVRIIPFETGEGGGVIRIAKEIVDEACGPESGIDPTTFPSQKSRSAYSAEELDLAAEIARRSDPCMSRFLLNALDTRGKRFGQTRFEPLSPSMVELLVSRYRSDLLFFSQLGNQ